MVLVSQTAFLNHNIAISSDTVLRVNCAWVRSYSELEDMLSNLRSFNVFLDLPTGRTKPPIPTLSLHDIIPAVIKFYNVKYFGLTNTTTARQVEDCKNQLPERVGVVPKIESLKGVSNLNSICKATSGSKYLMLDKEDLYTDVGGDIKKFEKLVLNVRRVATLYDKQVLELQGVIFATK